MEVAIVTLGACILGLVGVLVWNFIDRRGEAQLYREKVREVGQREKERDDAYAARDKWKAEAEAAHGAEENARATAARLRVALDAANAKVIDYEAKHLHDVPPDQFGADLDRVLSGQAPGGGEPAGAGAGDREPGPTAGVRSGPPGGDGGEVPSGAGAARDPRKPVEPDW